MGGQTPSIQGNATFAKDTWQSTDKGATWTLLNASSGWSGRRYSSAVAMADGSILLTGGANETNVTGSIVYHDFNDNWRSTDKGATWTRMSATSGWSGRFGHTSVALPDGSIVLIAGNAPNDFGTKNDVWRSTNNGSTWSQQTAATAFLERYFHASVALSDGTIVVTGGRAGGVTVDTLFNDTWQSTDKGATWTSVNSSSGWRARDRHGMVAMPDDSILLMGGNVNNTVDDFVNDTWRSTDKGATWTQIASQAAWTARGAFPSVVLPDGSIVLIGGKAKENSTSDYPSPQTWRLNPVGPSLPNPSHTYAAPGIYSVALQVYNAATYNSTRIAGYINVGVTAVPVASFTPNTTSGTAPLAVLFNDTSSNTPSEWNWSFTNVTPGNNTPVWFRT